MIKIKVFATILFAVICVVACTNTTETANTTEPANNEVAKNETPEATPLDEVAEGKKHYVENCARCHKEDGSGGKVDVEGKMLNVDDLTTEKMKKESDEEYLEYINDGIEDEGMPAFKDTLTEDQQKQVVLYIRKELQK